MTPERYQRMKRVLMAAAEKSGADRAAFLADACPSDADMRVQIEQILSESAAETVMLQSPVAVEADAVFGHPLADHQRIGDYEVLRLIGSGGMGLVYEAMQRNPQRVVALKVMRESLASDSARRRFEYESSILARLRHPGIAQIYETGVHQENGQAVPFFAMEYIAGARPITAYAAEKRLSTPARVELFLQVCDAVQHGHQQGIIHRDLKPGNVLVDSDGRVKVIDFGVARAAHADLSVTTLRTEIGQLIGTLQYMSPEQVEADPGAIDTRTDVYALGVVLHELMTGELPYVVRDLSLLEAARRICEAPPTRLSSHNRRLRGDLETIVLKALEKDPARRYQSTDELRHDLRRYLTGHPISARPASVIYQLRVFARRNRGFAIASLCALTFLVAGGVTSTVLFLRAESARQAEIKQRQVAEASSQEALRQADIAREVNAFLNDDLLSAVSPDKTSNRSITLREALDAAAGRIDGKFPDKPLIEAAIRITLGTTYTQLGELDAAVPHLQRAAELRLKHLPPEHEDLMGALSALATLHYHRGDYAGAEGVFRQLYELNLRTRGENDLLTAGAMNSLAFLYKRQGRMADALPLMERSVQISRALAPADDADTILMMTNLGQLYAELDRNEECERMYFDAYTRAKSTLGRLHPATMSCANNLATFYNRIGRTGQGIAILKDTLEAQQQVLGEDHPQTLVTRNNLGYAYLRQGRLDEAEPLLEGVLEARTRVLGEKHPHTLLVTSLVGSLRSAQGRYADAEQLHRRSLTLHTEVLGENHPDTLQCVEDLVRLFDLQHRYADGAPLLLDAIERLERSHAGDPQAIATYYNLYGEHLIKLDRNADAEAAFLKAQATASAAGGPGDPVCRQAIANLVELYSTTGREEQRATWQALLVEKNAQTE